jgi:hypothetical protein
MARRSGAALRKIDFEGLHAQVRGVRYQDSGRTVHRTQNGLNPAAGAIIEVGDRVRWNGRYEGRVVSVNCESAVAFERNNFVLGRTVRWHLRLDALVRVVD